MNQLVVPLYGYALLVALLHGAGFDAGSSGTLSTSMTTRDEIPAILQRQRELLDKRYPIRRLALFGSWARGDADEGSDVDILVEVDPSIGLRFVDLAEEIERAVGRWCRKG